MPSHLRTVAAGLVPLVLVPALGVAGGGFQPDTWVWAGALAAWAAAVTLAITDHPGALRSSWPWPAAAGTLVLWTLASAVWSVEPAQALVEARRTLVYAAVALALVVLARRRSGATVVAGAHAGVCALVLYALARYLVGTHHYLPFEGHLISEPLGYANAVGILSALGMLLSLAPVTGRSRGRRVGAAALVPPLALALDLSGSNASWLALAAGVVAFVVLHPSPRDVARPILAVVPPTAVAVAIGHVSRLTDPGNARLGGPIVALVALGCAAAAAAAVARLHPKAHTGRTMGRRTLVAVAVAAALLGAAVVARAAVTQPRTSYYDTAWNEYRAHPVLGSGAGTFARYWRRSGLEPTWGGALDAHSLYLETLAELGPAGVVLLSAFLLYPLRRAAARRHAPWVPAATGATVAFLVHAGLDWDWELPAVVVAGLACSAGIMFSDERASDEPLPRLARGAALAAALLLGVAAVVGVRSKTRPSDAEAPPGGASAAGLSAGARYL